jgi:putative transposase
VENSSSNWPNLAGARHLKDGQIKRARFTEEQIIGVLREHEAGAKTADLARKHGVSEARLYNWKAKFGVTCH